MSLCGYNLQPFFISDLRGYRFFVDILGFFNAFMLTKRANFGKMPKSCSLTWTFTHRGNMYDQCHC